MSAAPISLDPPAHKADDATYALALRRYQELAAEMQRVMGEMSRHRRGTPGRVSRIQRQTELGQQMRALRAWLRDQRRLRDNELGRTYGPAADAEMIRRLFGVCTRLLGERGGYLSGRDRLLLDAAAERCGMRPLDAQTGAGGDRP